MIFGCVFGVAPSILYAGNSDVTGIWLIYEARQ